MSGLEEYQNKIPALEAEIVELKAEIVVWKAELKAEGKSASEILVLLSEMTRRLTGLEARRERLEQQTSSATQAPAALSAFVPSTTIFGITVGSIPDSLVPVEEDKSLHASSMFNGKPAVVNWFRENVVTPIGWDLDHPLDIPKDASNTFLDKISLFEQLGFKVWDIQNRLHATSYIKVTSKSNSSQFITIAGRADFLVTKSGVSVAEYLSKILCVIEIQSQEDVDICEQQMLVYLLILMNTKNLPALVGILVLNNGQCRAFKATRDEHEGCIFEMNDLFHVGYIATVVNKVLGDLGLL